MTKRLLLLGAGHAQLAVLADLARQHMPAAELLLVSASERLVYSGMVPGLLAGRYAEGECAIAIEPLAAAAGVRFLRGRAIGLDATARLVQLADGRSLEYDVLALNVGATQDRDRIPGARENALFVRPIDEFVLLWRRARALAEQDPLDIVVVGGGAAGVEIALAIGHSLGERCSVTLASDGPLLPGYPEGTRRRALAALQRGQVQLVPGQCTAVEPGQACFGALRLACDLPIMAVGGDAPAWLADSGLALDAAGFVRTGATLQSASHANVFAVGDVATRDDAPHPRSGVFALRAGPVLAENLRRYVAGGELTAYAPQRHSLNLLSTGDGGAIASWGDWSLQGRLMGWWKERIDRAFVRRQAGQASKK
ncbi:MAG: FAD-dependent oxidoreductase [Pseudomonadota bacterium]